ncbi:UNVERIFIED_ORG: hypothetical protein ABIC62_002971 [Burkholderia sp. 1595]|uniref:Uncharacterized protein n=1 Tax=Paraburkholderia terricola TaxID=169427 RepID=A0ABU1LU65_9BURK|nr:hypothetical protein [Paraburkholderia terricola]MDR6481478.1 hypothetical protein [Paraburkholderia terricola]
MASQGRGAHGGRDDAAPRETRGAAMTGEPATDQRSGTFRNVHEPSGSGGATGRSARSTLN